MKNVEECVSAIYAKGVLRQNSVSGELGEFRKFSVSCLIANWKLSVKTLFRTFDHISQTWKLQKSSKLRDFESIFETFCSQNQNIRSAASPKKKETQTLKYLRQK